ncbi:amino acid adenylation domain-containing protein [Kordia sp. YSTF-M3]|uniref:Amino acid adenylation domain-containing protein n=1 Tax=Kordia aestuariivivens TaxID=2759037 RepID=A0ABR7QE77_9FLAO|nr:non-ribosomal peptide synthetase [Kordia aestuariivivens]MBC8756872.1 amino acid adenylation domain-containing protein [Kordia aestuariivivens]
MHKLLKEIKDNNLFIKLSKKEKLIVKVPRDKNLKELLSKMKLHKELLIDYLKSKDATFKEIPIISTKESYDLSSSQYRLWVLSQFQDGNVAYNIPSQIALNEINDISCFKKAVEAVISRHEILRTVFKTNSAGEVRQYILSKEGLDFNLEYYDFRNKSNPEALAQSYIENDSYQPFDLEKGPLLRGALLHTAKNTLIFYYNMHHIISDGWSMNIIHQDVQAFYNAFKLNTDVELPKLKIQYKDYAAWQLYRLQTEELKQSKAYWLNTLSDETPTLSLPTSKLRPKIKSYQGHRLHTSFSKETTSNLVAFSKENGGSVFMSLLSIWYVLFYKYTLQEDIIIGAPIAGRDHPDLENQIGFYVNTLALRSKIDPNDRFLDFYENVKTTTLKAYDNQAYPFDKLVEDLNLPHNPGRNMLFDVILAFQNIGTNKSSIESTDNLEHIITDQGTCFSKFDLEIKFEEIGGLLYLDFVYNTDIYDESFIKRLITHYKQLLKKVIASPDEKINAIDYLEDQERNRVLYTFNDTKCSYPKDKTVIDLFNEQVKNTPNSIALISGDEKITYKELDEQSNQLAHYLYNTYTIKNDDLIGVKLARDKRLIVSLLAVLKTGASYVPIDVNYPETRIEYIEKDTNCLVTIDEDFLKSTEGISLPITPVIISVAPTNLACVLYTSGSTGNPKGIMVTHRNIVSLIKPGDFFKLKNDDILLSTSSVSFDASIIEIYGALLNGATLVIEKTNNLLNPKMLHEMISKNAVNCFWMTSPWFNTLINNNHFEIFENITQVIVGGDIVSANHVKKLYEKAPNIKVINGYGPTENTTFSTTYTITSKSYTSIPIGKPIPNSSACILDASQNPVPIGVIGEIYLSGAGVAKGYLNKEKLTKEKFVPNPFTEGEKMYKSGDFGRWLPSGNIEFKGRKDHQVKLRGYRIELEEIEQTLLKYTGIQQAIVVVDKLEGEDALISYFIANEVVNNDELKIFLQKILPYYMVPQYYVQLENIPLTPNGKVDKQALPVVNIEDLNSKKEYTKPTNEVEEKLVQIWQEILGKEKISINDNFFQLGGHSLKMIVLMNKIKEHFNVDIKVDYLYQTPTIIDIGQYVSFFKSTEKDNNIENVII